MYTVFLILHIIVAGCWISILFANIAMMGNLTKAQGTVGELYLMRSVISIGSVMGNIGGIGILITGFGLVGIQHMGIFPFGVVNWLALKQTIFVILLVMTFAMMVPRVKMLRRLIAEELAGPDASKGASNGLRSQLGGIRTLGMMMNVLVLCNIILGVWKPNI
jgi:hypothetical protein